LWDLKNPIKKRINERRVKGEEIKKLSGA